ncbi:MAG: BamA/TamA family outer membrane protein [Bacteroidota bacterium]
MKTYFFRMAFGLLLVLQVQHLLAQNKKTENDTSSFKKYDILPAISYSPETRLTLGVIGYRYLNLVKDEPTTQSFINFIGVYTTANQLIIETNWEIFTNGDGYRFRGTSSFNQFPDRNYGLGNDAGVSVQEFEFNDGNAEAGDLFNYLRYSVNRLSLNASFLKKLRRHFYGGIRLEIEDQYSFEVLPDSVQILNQAAEIDLLSANTTGLRSGMGLALLWDSRDNILNPRRGSFIDFNLSHFGGYLGSDYKYTNLLIDGRKYYNPIKNHTLALRGFFNIRTTNDPTLPIRGLSRIGGSNLVRGYFQGTYQDDNMMAFVGEYRLPFWRDDVDAPLSQFWKRLGIVMYASAAQVYGQESDFGIGEFNYAVGTGLRILFNPETRINIRIDYALGLAADSNGIGSRQTGLYFFLAEAF